MLIYHVRSSMSDCYQPKSIGTKLTTEKKIMKTTKDKPDDLLRCPEEMIR